jgi:hypothetical protein
MYVYDILVYVTYDSINDSAMQRYTYHIHMILYAKICKTVNKHLFCIIDQYKITCQIHNKLSTN